MLRTPKEWCRAGVLIWAKSIDVGYVVTGCVATRATCGVQTIHAFDRGYIKASLGSTSITTSRVIWSTAANGDGKA